MVLLVLLVLMFLGIPFVASMLLKEKTNKNSLFLAKSRIAAVSARNYAIASLVRGCLSEERKDTALDPFNTPDYDVGVEFASREMTYTDVADPKGVIWSTRVIDEQSKINIGEIAKAAENHHTLMNNLISQMKPADKLDDYITEHSYRATPWVDAQMLGGYMLYQDYKDIMRTALYLKNSYWYSETGVRVRLTAGNREFISTASYQPCGQGLCLDANSIKVVPLEYSPHIQHPHKKPPFPLNQEIWRTVAAGGYTWLYIDRNVPPEFLTPDTIFEVEQPHAVNINTAPKELVTALLWELGRRYYDPIFSRQVDERISLGQAQMLATMIKSRDFANPTDWLGFLLDVNDSRIITGTHVSALWTNSRHPRSSAFYDIIDERFTGTLPFCYRSYDTYNIKSTGVVNYPSGLEAARTVFNDIVEVAPAQTATFLLESQYDFDEQFNMLLGNPRRFSTFPNVSTLRVDNYIVGSTEYVEPDYLRSTQPEIGELKLKTAEDDRGIDVIYKDSFEDTQEGEQLAGTALTYQSDDTFVFPPDPANKPDIYPGGIELWVKFSASPSGYIADIRQSEYENRISISYENNELILTVCDAGIERKSARVVAPVQLRENIWYHIGAYFEGTKHSGLALFLDGKPVGSFAHYDDMDRAIITELMADVPDTVTVAPGTDLIIPVKDTSCFPGSGVIQVGEEAIEYSEIVGGGFKVPVFWNMSNTPPTPVGNGRGQRGTVLMAHPAGAKVTPFGYSNLFVSNVDVTGPGFPAPVRIDYQPLPKGGATLVESILDTLPQTTINWPLGIDAADTVITVTSVTNFPNEGYVRLGNNEVIFYLGKDDNSKTLLNCRRGLLGTVGRDHSSGEAVDMYSIKVSDNTEYPSPGMIQIDDEWIGLVQKGETPEYFTGVVNGTTPVDFMRGVYGQRTPHMSGALIIPVLAADEPTCGKGDVVTIVEDDHVTDSKEMKTIRNAMRYNDAQTGEPKCLLAFFDNLSRNYDVDGITRMLKFPSDELPSYLPGNFYIGGDEAGGSILGMVDELKCYSGDQINRPLSDTLYSDTHNDRIRVLNLNGMSPSGGVIKIGDEIIGYGGIDYLAGEITGCVRGYLNSTPQTHDYRERIFYIPYLPVAALKNNLSPTDFSVPVSTMNGFSTDAAYLLVGNDFSQSEMIGYLWRDTGNGQFLMPSDRTGTGMFRGAFGTPVGSFIQGTLVYAMPFRYWHLEKRQAFHHEMAYFHTAHFSRDATWQKVRWTERHDPADDGLVQWRFLVRFDSGPHWADTPTNRKDGLFEFFSRNREQVLNIVANQIELLAFVQYQPGAFLTDSWKRAPALTNLYIDYSKPSDIISHQEE